MCAPPPDPPDQMPLVLMEEGLLLCPSCRSMDLSRTELDGCFQCDDCGARCVRRADQCPQCGSVGVTQVEQVGFPAPGQSPREAPRKLVRSCDACGYSSG